MRAAAAAAAAAGSPEALLLGLRLRRLPPSREEGDRERRSDLGGGSVTSKRERFRDPSDILVGLTPSLRFDDLSPGLQ